MLVLRGVHARFCPPARFVGPAIPLTTDLGFEELPAEEAAAAGAAGA